MTSAAAAAVFVVVEALHRVGSGLLPPPVKVITQKSKINLNNGVQLLEHYGGET